MLVSGLTWVPLRDALANDDMKNDTELLVMVRDDRDAINARANP